MLTQEQKNKIDHAYDYARAEGKSCYDSIQQAALVAEVEVYQACDYLIERTRAPGELL